MFEKSQPSFKWGLKGFKQLLPANLCVIPSLFKSLTNKNFALFFIGQCFSLTGAWIQHTAMGWLVFHITNSTFKLSIYVFLTQIPTLLFTPFAGIIADTFDRKKIFMVTQSLLMVYSFTLGMLYYFDALNINLIYVLALFFGTVISVDAPARQSFYVNIVPKEDVANAIALNSASMNGSRFIGPAIGGIMLVYFGAGHCFFINSVTFCAILAALFFINSKQVKIEKSKIGILAEIGEGFSYAYKSIPIRAVILMLVVFSFFSVPFVMLMPAFVKIHFNGGADILGSLMSFVGAGSLTAAIFLAARKSVVGLGKIITLSAMILGIVLISISFVYNIYLAYIICFFFGFGMISLAASVNTILQTLVLESKRGRIMSMFVMAFFGLPPVGSLVQGILSRHIPIESIIFITGIISIISAVVFEFFRPTVRKYAWKIFAEKGIVIPEIATALETSTHTNK